MTMTLEAFLAPLPVIDRESGTGYDKLAAGFRTELAAAVAAGVIPAGTKFSVRKREYKSYTVEIVGWAGAVFTDAYAAHLLDPAGTPYSRLAEPYDPRNGSNPEYVPALRDALDAVEKICNRHNWYECSPYDDYGRSGYFLSVNAHTVATAATAGLKLESSPKFAALLTAATKYAKELGPKVVKSVCGKTDLSLVGEWGLEQLVDVGKKAAGRPLVYSKTRRNWVVATGPAVPPSTFA